MHWNHRVLKETEGEGDTAETLYRIIECYYNDKGKPRGYCDPFTGSESKKGLRLTMKRMLKATKQPVLTPKDFLRKGKK